MAVALEQLALEDRALEDLVGPAGAGPYGAERARPPRLRVVAPEERAPATARRPASARRLPPAVYRRRRAVVAVLVLASVGAGVAGARALTTAEVADGPETAVRTAQVAVPTAERAHPATVVIGEGQTIWGRVAHLAPTGTDPREWVARVIEGNDVDPLAITPGTTLQLPPVP